jgi:hypothetical protein
VAGAGRAAFDQPRHVFGEPAHVEGAVFHADIDVVGPGVRVLAALCASQDVPTVAAGVIDRLVLRQKLDCPIDTPVHVALLTAGLAASPLTTAAPRL